MKKILFLSIILQVCFAGSIISQVDKHIDPNPKKHKHTLSIGKHVSTAFTIETAKTRFAFGTKILQECNDKVNDDQDVGCKVTVEPGATMGSFGMAGDGLDVINTQAELTTVMNNNSFTVKVVTTMPGDGTGLCGAAGAILACATTSGTASIVIVSGLTDAEWGEVLIHEFGHTRGLAHRDAPGKPIMHTSTLGNTEVNAAEAAAYHTGGVEDGDNRPVDILFLIDDTGSMSEEIGGVRNFLTLLLSLFPADKCGTVFQLVTFKDNVTQRQPTTDLNVIKNQVAALVASGGGDCPEASVEALNASKDKVKDKGLIFLATDADPHPGLDIEAAAASLAARNIIFSTLLSGECFGGISVASSSASATSYSSDNHDPSASTSGSGSTSLAAATFSSATEAYSFICDATGGVFAFIPQVNSGNPADRAYYENIGYNIILGGIIPTITNLQPNQAPQGSTIALTVSASKTNFNASTTLMFNDPSITVGSISVISATKLSATIQVGAATALGFKDIKATTDLGGGMTEIADGLGLLQVIAPPTTPTILSISPNSVTIGQTLSVKITGINTHFTNSSVPNLGAGIDINTVNAVSDVELDANITVTNAAPLGFHNVSVTTGGEIATESVPGPLIVIGSSCGTLPEVTSIVTSDADAFCNGVIFYPVITPGSNSGPFTGEWSYNGGVVSSNINIHLNNSNPDGIYTVVVKDGNSCASDPFSFNYMAMTYINNYLVYAKKEARFDENNNIHGSVGVSSVAGKAEFKKGSSLLPPEFVKAQLIIVDPNATVPNRFATPATGVALPPLQVYAGNTNGLPSYTAPKNSVMSFGNAKQVQINKDAKVTLTGNNYGKIDIDKGAEVTFTQSSVDVEEIKMGGGGHLSDMSKLIVDNNTVIRVAKKVDIGKYASVNPTMKVLTFYLMDEKPDDEKFNVDGKSVNVVANVVLTMGKMKVKGDKKEMTMMTGKYIVEKLDAGDNIEWYGFDCSTNAVHPKMPASITKGNSLEDNVKEYESEKLKVTVAPNPSSSFFTLYVKSDLNESITVRVTDLSGRVLEINKAIMQDGTMKIGHDLPKGVYFVFINKGKESKALKLIKY